MYSYLFAAIAYTIAYIYALVFAPFVSQAVKENPNYKPIEDVHRSCVAGCESASFLIEKGRGDQYYIGAENSTDINNCVVTFWGLTHFVLYFVLGMVAPNLFWETFMLGVGFEVYEYVEYGCQDIFDIVLNSTGFITGKHVRGLLFT